MLFQLLVVFIELTEFIRKNVGIWHKVKVLFTISFLHSDNIETKPILPCNLMTLWEVINLLVLIQAFIKVTLAAR